MEQIPVSAVVEGSIITEEEERGVKKMSHRLFISIQGGVVQEISSPNDSDSFEVILQELDEEESGDEGRVINFYTVDRCSEEDWNFNVKLIRAFHKEKEDA